MTTEIRLATTDDCNKIQKLSNQLGYNPTKESVLAALQEMQKNLDYEAVVITEDNNVVGWMTICVRHRMEDAGFLQVTAIVTELSRRGSGLGKKLMIYAEQRAQERNLSCVGLHSSKRRNDAHHFYESVGYLKNKESYFFSKNLTDSKIN